MRRHRPLRRRAAACRALLPRQPGSTRKPQTRISGCRSAAASCASRRDSGGTRPLRGAGLVWAAGEWDARVERGRGPWRKWTQAPLFCRTETAGRDGDRRGAADDGSGGAANVSAASDASGATRGDRSGGKGARRGLCRLPPPTHPRWRRRRVRRRVPQPPPPLTQPPAPKPSAAPFSTSCTGPAATSPPWRCRTMAWLQASSLFQPPLGSRRLWWRRCSWRWGGGRLGTSAHAVALMEGT